MQEICNSNPPVVTGIFDPNKSRARHHHSWKLGSKLKYLIHVNIFLKTHFSIKGWSKKAIIFYFMKKFDNSKKCPTILSKEFKKLEFVYPSKILLKKDNTICVKIDGFINKIVRGFRGFILWAPTRALPWT